MIITVLKIWRFDFFCRFGLKCLFTPPKIWVWGSEPLNVIGHHRDPQKVHPWPEPHLRANFGTDRSTDATCAWAEGIKKKGQGKKLTVANWVFAQTTHVDAAICGLHAGLWEVVISFKFRQNRLNGFRDVGVEICHFLYLRSVAYNSMYY